MIIGMTGLAGSGKDTVADILVRDHAFAKVALADPLKRICKEVFQFTDEQLWGPSSMRNTPDVRYLRGDLATRDQDPKVLALGLPREDYLTPRHALQQLGTEWGRRCYDNVWVDYALRIAHTLLTPGGFMPAYNPQRGLYQVTVNSSEGYHYRYPKGVVISDVRFPNEVNAIRAKGGRIWKTMYGKGLGGVAGQHESEAHVDSIKPDAVVPDSALEALPGIVTNLLKGARQ